MATGPLAQTKRDVASVPFAAQLDDIDKALFEYRYKKQNQQYHHQDCHHHRGNNVKSAQHLKNGKSTSHGFHHHPNGGHQIGLQPRPVSVGPKFANGARGDACMKKNKNGAVGALPQQHVHQPAYHQHPNPLQQQLYVQQPQPLPVVSSHSVSIQRFGYSNVVASSPDSFVEDFIHSKMSSSVSSGGSTSSYGSYDQFDLSKNQIDLSTPNTLGTNKASVGMTNVNYNDNVFSNNLNGTIVGRSEKSLGWLNIWGNDMSVWS